MHRSLLWLGLCCLVTFHAPDGSLLTVDTANIALVRTTVGITEHLAKGTNALVYIAGQRAIGITETREEAEDIIRGCE